MKCKRRKAPWYRRAKRQDLLILLVNAANCNTALIPGLFLTIFLFAAMVSINLGMKTCLPPKRQINLLQPISTKFRMKLASFHSIIRESWAQLDAQHLLESLNSDLLPPAYEPVQAVGRRSICYILCLTQSVLCAENFTSKQFFPLYCDLSLHPLNLSLSAEPCHHVLR